MVGVGETAPPFTLPGVAPTGEIREYSLAELTADATLVLCVYVYDFSPKCTSQLCTVRELEWLTLTEGLVVAGLGADGPYAHRHFAAEHDLAYPLLSDTDLSVCADYGVREAGRDRSAPVPRRSVFLIDDDQQIRYVWVADDNWDDWETSPLEDVRTRLDGVEV